MQSAIHCSGAFEQYAFANHAKSFANNSVIKSCVSSKMRHELVQIHTFLTAIEAVHYAIVSAALAGYTLQLFPVVDPTFLDLSISKQFSNYA